MNYTPDFLCNFLMARFIHFSGLLNPGQSLPPAIGLAKNMNTEKKKVHIEAYLVLFKIFLNDYPMWNYIACKASIRQFYC